MARFQQLKHPLVALVTATFILAFAHSAFAADVASTYADVPAGSIFVHMTGSV